MIYKYFLAVLTVFFLSGCGGGGEDLSANMDGSADGSSGGTATNQSAEGLWSGYISKGQNMDAVGLILPSGNYYFATGNNHSSLITGKGTTSGSTFNSQPFYDPDGLFVSSDGKISGMVTTKGNLNAVFGNSNAISSLAYLNSYGSTPTISNLFGKAYSSLYSSSTSFTFPNELDKKDQLLQIYFSQDDCYFSAKIGSIANNENNYFSMSLSVYDQPDKIGACKKITDPPFPINGYAVPWTNNNTPHLILIGVDSNQSKWFSSVFKLK